MCYYYANSVINYYVGETMSFMKNIRINTVLLSVLAALVLSGCGSSSEGPDYLVEVGEDSPVSATYTNSLEMSEIAGYDGKPLQAEISVCNAFEKLKADLAKEKITIGASAAFISYEEQEKLYKSASPSDEITVPAPGKSEHQTGFAIDFVIKDSSGWITDKSKISESELLPAIHKQAIQSGFTVSDSDKPWHLRFVGEKVSKELADRGVSLESYVYSLTPHETKDEGLKYAYTIDEMLDGIASKNRIILNSSSYDLSKAQNYGKKDVSPYYYWEESGDEYNLVIHDVDGLVIESRDTNPYRCNIQADPGCSHVIRFEDCNDIELEGLTLSHEDKSSIFSSIVTLKSCTKADITKCRLYGGSVVGIVIDECERTNIDFCYIKNCTQNALSITKSNNVEEMTCDFTECAEPVIYVSEDSEKIIIEGKYISDEF